MNEYVFHVINTVCFIYRRSDLSPVAFIFSRKGGHNELVKRGEGCSKVVANRADEWRVGKESGDMVCCDEYEDGVTRLRDEKNVYSARQKTKEELQKSSEVIQDMKQGLIALKRDRDQAIRLLGGEPKEWLDSRPSA